MSKLYEKNLKYLNKLCPEFYQKVIKVKESTAIIARTKNNKKNIIKYVKGKKLSVHSNYNPVEQAKVISNYALEENSDIIVIFGMGLAYELKEMIKKDPRKRYVIIEPDIQIFKIMLENIDFESFFNEYYKLTLILENSSALINAHLYAKINEEKTPNIRHVVLPYYQNVYGDLINETFKLLKETIRLVEMNFMIDLTTDRQWVLNYARNVQYLHETLPIEKLKDYFKGVPAIIIGAGPSLEYNIQHLKKLGDKALIIGAGNGAKVLEKNDIKAHIIGAMDGNEDTQKIYENLEVNKDVNLFYSSQVFSTVPSFINGKKFLMDQVVMDLYINKKFGSSCRTAFSGPSITNVLAYNLAKLECNPIIFLGQDLSSRDGKFYAKGTIFDDADLTNLNNIKMKNIQGEDVYTNKGYLFMKENMETIIQMYPNITYLNGTKYGLNIEGSKNIDFNEYADTILLNGKDCNFKFAIEDCFKSNCEEDFKETVNNFIVNLKNTIDRLSKILEDIVLFIDGKEKDKRKENYIIEKEKELEKNSFYKEVLHPKFNNTLEFMFKSKNGLYRKKQIYLYYRDKCNVMINGLNDLYTFS